MSLRTFARRGRALAALSVLALALTPALAEARPSGGKSSGSRGSKTFMAPPSTSTAPGAAQPMQRSMTPDSGPSMQQPGMASRPAASPAAQPAKPTFARNLMMGIGAGLLGAGLFGLLSGSGLFGGLGGLASFLGLLLQAALIAGLIFVVVRLFRRRQEAPQPALAGAGLGSMNREAYAPPQPQAPLGGGAAAQRGGADQVGLNAADFDVFEQKLRAVSDAYSREDLAALRRMATPEMVGYFAEDLAENARKGLIDTTREVKLLQGDLSEAWREEREDYATVAMRYSYLGTLSERATGRVIEGNASAPQEATELWTFVRPRGGDWLLSAIQQAG